MTIARHPHPFASRWGLFVVLAFVAIMATSLLIADWAVAIPGGMADAAPAARTNTSTAPMDLGQQFYTEKTMAPAQELPAQF